MALLGACGRGDWEEVRRIIDVSGLSPDEIDGRDVEGKTPLHFACEGGQEDIVSAFLSDEEGQKKNIVNLGSHTRSTPLHLACERGYNKIILLLVNAHADATIKDEDGWTPFSVACRKGHEIVVGLLLPTNNNINLQSNFGTTSLHDASEGGHKEVVRLLLSANPNINIQDNIGRTALHWACERGHDLIVPLLLSANPNINVEDNEGRTALYLAYKKGHDTTVSLLIKDNPNIDMEDKEFSSTLLHYACEGGQEHMVKSFLSTSIDINRKDKRERTPLLLACDKGHENIVKLLLSPNSSPPLDVNSKARLGITALHRACEKRFVNIVALLLNVENIDINIQNSAGKTPLHVACQYGHQDIASLLFSAEKKPDIDLKDQQGKKPGQFISDDFFSNREPPFFKQLWKNGCQTGVLRLDDSIFNQEMTDELLAQIPWKSFAPFLKSITINGKHLSGIPIGLAEGHNLKEINFLESDHWGILDKNLKSSSAKEICHYCQMKEQGEMVTMKSMRLMVLGSAAVGKTTMVGLLGDKKFDKPPDSTDGIDLGEINLIIDNQEDTKEDKEKKEETTIQSVKNPSQQIEKKRITLQAWDFGGQKIYRISHQIFLRDNCLYAVVFRLDDPDDTNVKNEIRYWIDSVRSRTEQKNIKILLIGSHADSFKDREAACTRWQTMWRMIFKEYGKAIFQCGQQLPGIFWKESQEMGLIDTLRDQFFQDQESPGDSLRNVLKQAVQVNEIEVPACMEVIRGVLEGFKEKGLKYLPLELVMKELVSEGIRLNIKSLQNEKTRITSLNMLDRLGYILIVGQGVGNVRKRELGYLKQGIMVVIDLMWITDLLATIITTKQYYDGGILKQSNLIHSIWKNTTKEGNKEMLNILMQMNIIFPLRKDSEEQEYFAPCLLQEEPPSSPNSILVDFLAGNKVHQKKKVVLERHFKMKNKTSVPIAVIPMVVVELMCLGKLSECWQQGCYVVFGSGECRCIIKKLSFDKIQVVMSADNHFIIGKWMNEVMVSFRNMLEKFYLLKGKYSVDVLYQGEQLIPSKKGERCASCCFDFATLYSVSSKERMVKCKEKHEIPLNHLIPDALFEMGYPHLQNDWKSLKVIKTLGKGGFGVVYLCEKNKTFCAVKVLQYSELKKEKEIREEFQWEVYLMQELDHPNIVSLLGIVLPSEKPFEEDYHSQRAMILELCQGGDLQKQITFRGFNLEEKYSLFKKLAVKFHREHESNPQPIDPLETFQGGLYGEVKNYFDRIRQLAGEKYYPVIDTTEKKVTESMELEHSSWLQYDHDEHIPLVINNFYDSLPWFISWPLRLKLLIDIALGIAYFHSLNPPLVHRDIKSQNIFLTQPIIGISLNEETLARPLVKIGDFGLSLRMKALDTFEGNEGGEGDHQCETWAAPEALKKCLLTTKVDIYSFAIVMWELLYAKVPFEEVTSQAEKFKEGGRIERIEAIINGYRPQLFNIHYCEGEKREVELEMEYINLMKRCWSQEPSLRPDAVELCQFLKEMIDNHLPILSKVLSKNESLENLVSEKVHSEGTVKRMSRTKLPILDLITKTNNDPQSLNKSLETSKIVKKVVLAKQWLWLAFESGAVGAINAQNPEEIYYCHETENHWNEIRAMTYQPSGNYVWTASNGCLHVWNADPQDYHSLCCHLKLKGWWKLKGIFFDSEKWVLLDGGKVKIFNTKTQKVEEICLVITKKSQITSTKTTLKLKTEKKTITLIAIHEGEPPPTGSQREPKEFSEMNPWVYALRKLKRGCSQKSSLIRLGKKTAENPVKERKETGILSFEALGHCVWLLTAKSNEFLLQHFQLELNPHGLNRDLEIRVSKIIISLPILGELTPDRFQSIPKPGMIVFQTNILCVGFEKKFAFVDIKKLENPEFLDFIPEKVEGKIDCFVSVWNPSCGRGGGALELWCFFGNKKQSFLYIWGYESEEEREKRVQKKKGKEKETEEKETKIEQEDIESLLVLLEVVEVPNNIFFASAVQVALNEVWAGTEDGCVLGWCISSRKLLKSYFQPEGNKKKDFIEMVAHDPISFGSEKEKSGLAFSTNGDEILQKYDFND